MPHRRRTQSERRTRMGTRVAGPRSKTESEMADEYLMQRGISYENSTQELSDELRGRRDGFEQKGDRLLGEIETLRARAAREDLSETERIEAHKQAERLLPELRAARSDALAAALAWGRVHIWSLVNLEKDVPESLKRVR